MWHFYNAKPRGANNAASQQKIACMKRALRPLFVPQTRFGALLSWTFPP